MSTAMRQDHCRPSLAISENKMTPKIVWQTFSQLRQNFNTNQTRSEF
jgi:hypothetical protein